MKLINRSFWCLCLIVLIGCNTKPEGQERGPISSGGEPKFKKGDVVRAVYNDDLSAIKALLAQGAYINENVGSPTQEITPLLVAVALGREAVAHYLIERGAALHSQYRGYKPEDFSLHVYGDASRVTRTLRYEGRPVVREGVK